MPDPTPYSLSKLFSQLIGRKVQFSQTTAPPETKLRQLYAIYQVLPQEHALVVQADLALLGSLGGVLVGLPTATIKEHLKTTPMEEVIRDAIYEVMNIAAAAVTMEGRAVFTRMVEDRATIEGAAATLLTKPDRKLYFSASVDGYEGGKFTIYAQSPPLPTAQI